MSRAGGGGIYDTVSYIRADLAAFPIAGYFIRTLLLSCPCSCLSPLVYLPTRYLSSPRPRGADSTRRSGGVVLLGARSGMRRGRIVCFLSAGLAYTCGELCLRRPLWLCACLDLQYNNMALSKNEASKRNRPREIGMLRPYRQHVGSMKGRLSLRVLYAFGTKNSLWYELISHCLVLLH